ncbi:hypothetical protein RI129_003653 [Pyrocoelia pectoralis]|uniref:UDP-glucuronosyltransferase n=1 Tax=Pyrocoelia pectoralis TaxID=417401 RepID=A0AAN7VPX1_9COLE
MRLIVLLFFYLKLIRNINGANILLIGALPSPSHYLWNKVLLTELVKNGHNVTIITHDNDSTKMENYTVITMKGFYEHLDNEFPAEEYMFETNIFNFIYQGVDYGAITCTFDFSTDGFKVLMDYPQNFTFDLIIYDIAYPVCLYGLIPRFNNPPVVAVTAFLLIPHLSYSFGNPLQTSHIPHYCSKFTNQMNLRERLTNTMYSWADFLIYKYISIPRQTAITRAVFGQGMIPPLDEIERNISLLLVNTDPVLDYPMALTPNIIPVGGLHIKPAKSLPQDFEAIYNKAKDGVIVFSLGTNVKSNILNKNHTDAFLKVFSTLKQVVIWKFETGELENVPQNVFIRKWLPQNDLIGHSNTKLFITHFGGLGTQEAMYHGVPMVGFPVYVDQHVNAAKLAEKKIALYLDYDSLTYENIYNTITEVLNNPMYKNNIVKLSQRYKNQPLTALERAVFWIEHVLKNGDVHYLNVPTRDTPMYQAFNLDVILLITICLVFICAVVKSVFRCCLYVLHMFKQNKVKEKVM